MSQSSNAIVATPVRLVRLTELHGINSEKRRDLYVNPALVQFVHADWRNNQSCSVIGLGGESFFNVAEPPEIVAELLAGKDYRAEVDEIYERARADRP